MRAVKKKKMFLNALLEICTIYSNISKITDLALSAKTALSPRSRVRLPDIAYTLCVFTGPAVPPGE